MKKRLLTICVLLSCAFLLSGEAKAQCTSCAIDPSCMPAAGGLCPDSLPGATQGTPYSQDVTFYLPPQISVTSPINLGMVPLKRVFINNVSGLPFGLTWQANNANKTYYPSNGENHGCVKICGTTYVAPGTYPLTVNVDATVAAGGILGDQSGSQSFSFLMEVLPSSSGNPVFNLTPTYSCGGAPMSFSSNMTVSYPQYIEYAWDFGDGTTSTNRNETHSYTSTGSYTVTNTTTISQLAITRVEFTSNTTFHTCSGASTPKTKVRLTSGSSSTGFTPTTSNKPFIYNVNWVLDGSSVSLWMEDEVSSIAIWCSNKTAVANITGITGPGTYNFVGSDYAITGFVTVSAVNPSPFTASETVNAYSAPAATTIQSSSNSFDLCDGDSITLSVYSGYAYRWYHNDTVEIANSDTNAWTVKVGGRYRVDIADPVSGCVYTTPTVTVNLNAGVLANLAVNYNGTYLSSSVTGAYTYQWQILNGATWYNIPAPLGTQSIYTPNQSGSYRVTVTSVDGCSRSAERTITGVSIDEASGLTQLNIYPVPSDGIFNVMLEVAQTTDVQISLLDLSGRILKMELIKNVSGLQTLVFDATNTSAGVYILNTRINGIDKQHRVIIK